MLRMIIFRIVSGFALKFRFRSDRNLAHEVNFLENDEKSNIFLDFLRK